MLDGTYDEDDEEWHDVVMGWERAIVHLRNASPLPVSNVVTLVTAQVEVEGRSAEVVIARDVLDHLAPGDELVERKPKLLQLEEAEYKALDQTRLGLVLGFDDSAGIRWERSAALGLHEVDELCGRLT